MKAWMSSKYAVLGAVVTLSVIFDQWTKHIIHRHFRLGESVPVIRAYFDITYLRNRGAAFSFLDSAPPAFRDPFFLVVPLVAMSAILYVLLKLKGRQTVTTLALSLVFGGALGNLIDRLQLGYVVDFLYFHWKTAFYWPAFNVADSCIVVGVGILFAQSLFRKPNEAEKSSELAIPKH